MAEELEDLRATELWEVLDWSLWGNGLGDVLRESIADAAIAALSDEQREQAEACIKAWHARRGPSFVVAYGPELEAQRDEARRERDLLLWLHAEAVWMASQESDKADHWFAVADDEQTRREDAELEVERLRREVEFEANGSNPSRLVFEVVKPSLRDKIQQVLAEDAGEVSRQLCACVTNETYGFRGGHTADERARILRRQNPKKPDGRRPAPVADVAAMLAAGWSCPAIAARLDVHVDSVRRIRRKILREQGEAA